MRAAASRHRRKPITLAGLRRAVSWSFLACIAAGGVLFAMAFLGEGLAQSAIRQGRPEPDLRLAVIAVIVVFYGAAVILLVASGWALAKGAAKETP